MTGMRDKRQKSVTVILNAGDLRALHYLGFLPPSLSSVSKTLHSCKVIACCVVKCFSMLEVFPPLDVIKALHVLQLALVLSFLVKYNQTLERFCLDAMMKKILNQNMKRAHEVIAQMRQMLAEPINGIVRQAD